MAHRKIGVIVVALSAVFLLSIGVLSLIKLIRLVEAFAGK